MKKYKEIKREVRKHHAEMAEHPPDPKASERFRTPVYQTGQLAGAQINTGLRWIDLVDYMLLHVMDGSIKLTDPVVLPTCVNAKHMDVAEYLANKYDIKRGVNADGQKCDL